MKIPINQILINIQYSSIIFVTQVAFFPHQASLHPLHLLLSDLGLLGNQAKWNERTDQRAYTTLRTCQVSLNKIDEMRMYS